MSEIIFGAQKMKITKGFNEPSVIAGELDRGNIILVSFMVREVELNRVDRYNWNGNVWQTKHM